MITDNLLNWIPEFLILVSLIPIPRFRVNLCIQGSLSLSLFSLFQALG